MGAANPLASGVTQQVDTPHQTVHLSWMNRRCLCWPNNKIYFHRVCNVCFHQPILNSHLEITHQRTGLKFIAESLHIQMWIQPRALLLIAFNTSLQTLLATRLGFCHSSLPRDPMTWAASWIAFWVLAPCTSHLSTYLWTTGSQPTNSLSDPCIRQGSSDHLKGGPVAEERRRDILPCLLCDP